MPDSRVGQASQAGRLRHGGAHAKPDRGGDAGADAGPDCAPDAGPDCAPHAAPDAAPDWHRESALQIPSIMVSGVPGHIGISPLCEMDSLFTLLTPYQEFQLILSLESLPTLPTPPSLLPCRATLYRQTESTVLSFHFIEP